MKRIKNNTKKDIKYVNLNLKLVWVSNQYDKTHPRHTYVIFQNLMLELISNTPATGRKIHRFCIF
jgi:hypothetical protein